MPTLTNNSPYGITIQYDPIWNINDATATPAAWASVASITGDPCGLSLGIGQSAAVPSNFTTQILATCNLLPGVTLQ